MDLTPRTIGKKMGNEEGRGGDQEMGGGSDRDREAMAMIHEEEKINDGKRSHDGTKYCKRRKKCCKKVKRIGKRSGDGGWAGL